MKPRNTFIRTFAFRNRFIEVSSNFKRKKISFYRAYGTSSKPADGRFTTKSNWFSVIKNTSDSVLPVFWKSVQVSSAIINHVLLSVKKSSTDKPDPPADKPAPSTNETDSPNDKPAHSPNKSAPSSEKQNFMSKDTQVVKFELKDSVSQKEPEKAQDLSYLEQAFFDWLSPRNSREKRKEFLEKGDKPASKSKKTLISKASLQQRSRFLVNSLDAASSGFHLLRLEEVCKHLLLYPHQKTEMCKAGLQRIVLRLKYCSDDIAVQSQAAFALSLIGYHEPPRGQGIRILSIDGGGTRGIMAIEVLRQLEAKTNKKIYELFDYICGVSSGAILGVFLGALRLSLDECEHIYRKLSNEVFSQSAFWGTSRLMWSHAYYDTTMWVNVLKKTFGEKLLIETAKYEDTPKIGVISAIMNLPSLQPFVFRNYDFPPEVQSHYYGSCQYRMWESIRASGAAPGYFEEYCLDEFLHQDGGIIVNNPAALGIHEAHLIWPSEPIQCMLSLGSGRYIPSSQPTFTSTNLKTKVLKIIDSATDTEGTHVVLNDLLSPYTYFRINPYLTEFLTLDENRAEKLDQMKIDAQMYLRRNEYKFENCARTLCIPRSSLKKAKDWLMTQKKLYL